jgi:hypothetical protein
MMSLPSHAGIGVAKSCWRWHCRADVGSGVMSSPSHAGDSVAELCHEGATELSIVRSSDLHMAIRTSNDSSSSPMTQTCRIQKISRICMKHHNETSH